tara:strand:+ start:248 stop:448 length:201 start_codon:yes stop_codon:yes gene_type:complete
VVEVVVDHKNYQEVLLIQLVVAEMEEDIQVKQVQQEQQTLEVEQEALEDQDLLQVQYQVLQVDQVL